jgi:hypothetical protein
MVEATETSDEVKRKELMDEILKYNEEDLAATWAVFEWLQAKTPIVSATRMQTRPFFVAAPERRSMRRLNPLFAA